MYDFKKIKELTIEHFSYLQEIPINMIKAGNFKELVSAVNNVNSVAIYSYSIWLDTGFRYNKFNY